MHPRGTLLPGHWLQRWIFDCYEGIELKETCAYVWWMYLSALVLDLVFYCWFVCLFQLMEVGHHGLCGLTAQWLVVMERRFEPTPASTPHLGTTALTVLGQRGKQKTVPLSPVLVCFHIYCYFSSRCTGAAYMLYSELSNTAQGCCSHWW